MSTNIKPNTHSELKKILKNCVFNNKHVTIILDENNKPWFRGKDIAEILEYSDTYQAIKKNVSEENRKKQIDIISKNKYLTYNEKNTIFINKDGLFSLILSSKKEVAKMFKKWIIKDILPLINNEKNINKEICDIIDDLSNQLEKQLKIIGEQIKINEQLETQILK